MNLKSTGGEGGVTLKPCPFCGSTSTPAARWILDGWSNTVFCEVCEAQSGSCETASDAAQAWNLRSCAQDAPGVSEEDLALIIEALRDKELHHADVHRTHGTEEFMTGHGPLAKRCAELAQRLRGAGSGK